MQLPPVLFDGQDVNSLDTVIVHQVAGRPYFERDRKKILYIVSVQGYFKMSKSDRRMKAPISLKAHRTPYAACIIQAWVGRQTLGPSTAST